MDSILTGYTYLQPPVEVNLIQHDPIYIKSGHKETAQRKIFYAVPLDEFELSKIRDLEAALIQKGVRLPQGWNERETLRYVYGAKFNMETAIANIQLSLRWRGTRNNNVIPLEATRLLESGAVYTYGRDAMFRPIVIIDFGKLNTQNFDIENFQIALITLLDILKEYCFVPGRVENWIIILDTRRINFSQFPLKELSPLKTLLTACYPVTLERLIVVNASESVFSSWKNIESLVDQVTLKKIIILEAHETNKIHSILPKNQLEAKFGGNLPDLTKFWIPRVPFSNSSPSKSNTNSNLENSLARLSQQIETVEGKFQKIFSPDNKVRNSQTTSPNYQAYTTVNPTYTSSPTRVSGFPEPRAYSSYSNNQSQVLQSPYSREQYGEREKKASFPVRDYEDISRTRSQYITPNVVEYTRESYPRTSENEATKKSTVTVNNNEQDETKAPENSVTEQSIHYDFNDNNLIDLIMSENDTLLTNKKPAITKQILITQNQEIVTKSGNYGNYTDANREVLKTIPRSSTGDNRPKTLNDYNTQPNRTTYLPDSIITRHEPLINNGETINKSTPYYSSTYTTSNISTSYITRNNDYSTQPQPRFVEGRTEYEIAKSNLPIEQAKREQPRRSNQPGYESTMRTSQASNQGQYEEWNPQKYIKKKEEDEEAELEGGNGFCGLCVKSRKKEKAVKA